MTIEFDELGMATGERDAAGRGRRRMVAGVVAVMLVAAAAGAGYGIGRNVDGDDVADEPTAAGGVQSDAEARAVGPTTVPVDETPGATEPAFAVDMNQDIGVQSSGGVGYPAFGTQPMDPLFERSTDGGLTLRVSLGEIWDVGVDGDWGAGDWRPAPWCHQSGQMRVAMSGNGVIDVGGVPWYSDPFEGRAVSWLLLGGNDGAPQWVVVVQVPADVTNVRLAFSDGSTDEVAPQGGIAALTVPAPPSSPVTEGGRTYWIDPTPLFEVSLEGGLDPVTIGSDGEGSWDDPAFRAACTPPPPALPAAGEQPADPVAAEAEITAAMTALYGAIGSDSVQSDLVDDPTGVTEAREQVQAGGYAEDAAGAEVTIVELVFTAPDEAWFRYSIDTPGNDFDNRYGRAVVVDGVWKITRSTVCQDLSLAGGDCGEGWQTIYPPGAFPDGGPGPFGDEYLTPVTTMLLDD